ncbi:MAG: efflux RND transporter periplasmic adaptor subunit [Chloroflexota bacterium]|nr:efflux RND transporter periplasmic adaptor subunit [Chloroflexota bacterium]
MKHRGSASVITLVLILLLSGCRGWGQKVSITVPKVALQQPDRIPPHLVQSKPSPCIEASGTIEAHKVEVAAELGGRVVKVAAGEGDRVERGQLLVSLDESDLTAQITRAQGALKVARAELAQAQAGPRPEEIAAARSSVQQATAQAQGKWQDWQNAEQILGDPQDLKLRITEARTALKLAERDLEMAEAELEAAQQSRDREEWGTVEYRIAQKKVEAAEWSLKAAQATRDGARAKLAALQAMLEEPLTLKAKAHAAEAAYQVAQADVTVARAELASVEAPPLAEDVAIARAKVHQEEATLHTLEVRRKKMTLRAPCDGLISSRAVEVGEVTAPGAPLMTIADLSEVTLAVYVPETQIGQVKMGQEAVITVDSYPDKGFMGRVTHIADEAEFTPRNVQTEEQRVNLVFAVKITLPNPKRRLKPGMPADALIQVR